MDFCAANGDPQVFVKGDFTAITTCAVAPFVDAADEVYGEDLWGSGDGCGFYGGDFEGFPVYVGGEIDFIDVEVDGLGGLVDLSEDCAETGCCAEEGGGFGGY